MSFFMIRPWGGQFWHLFWNILKKNLQRKIWRIFWINLIFLLIFYIFCIFWHFPNFLSILGDFPTKFKIFDCFWHFFKFWSILGLIVYQDEISKIFSQFWGIFQQNSKFLIVFGILEYNRAKCIPRLNFPNFLSIIVDFHSSSISFQRNLQSLDKAGLLNQFGPF